VPVLGVTGGIATGKSSLTAALVARLPASEVFDSDRCAHELLESSPVVRAEIVATFGVGVCDGDGKPDRARLRELVFNDAAARRNLEKILHPAIRNRWIKRAAQISGSWFVVDIPLLYETAAESHFDRILVVACSDTTQRERLGAKRGLAGGIADKIIASQIDLRTKIEKAHHVIWNDSTLACLERQAALLAGWLLKDPWMTHPTLTPRN
jgi:dephospho-CoA kinase